KLAILLGAAEPMDEHRRIGEACVPEFGDTELHEIGAIGAYPGKLGGKKSGEHPLMQWPQLNDLAKAGVLSRRPPNARFIQPSPATHIQRVKAGAARRVICVRRTKRNPNGAHDVPLILIVGVRSLHARMIQTVAVSHLLTKDFHAIRSRAARSE